MMHGPINIRFIVQSSFLLKKAVYSGIYDSLQCGTVVACLFVYGLFDDAVLTSNVQRNVCRMKVINKLDGLGTERSWPNWRYDRDFSCRN